VVGAVLKVAVAPEWIAAGEIEVAFGPEVQSVQALVNVAEGNAPDEAFDLDVFALGHGVGDEVDGADGGDVEVVAANGDVVDPGVFGEADEELAWVEAAFTVGLIDEEGFTCADEEAAHRVKADAEEGFLFVGVDVDEFELGVGEAVGFLRGGSTGNDEDK